MAQIKRSPATPPRGWATLLRPAAFIPSAAQRPDLLELRGTGWWAHHGVTLLRLSLGVVFFWFGVLKFFPGVSAAQNLATHTIPVPTLGHMLPAVSLPSLATWECAIGLELLPGGKFLKVALVVGATSRGGRLIHDSHAADSAERTQQGRVRFWRHFRREL